ncbi:hypothetical protein CFC21_055186, partial [Triticum aestivum]|uniref:NB-ARC domain-containing protein n=2 Tax=Triticum aestivum TaxID=4565 RepID=A0A3B6I1S5_WHEAT
MKAFSEDDSTNLLLQSFRAAAGVRDIPGIIAKLLRICDGLPLAIIVAAGSVYKKSKELADELAMSMISSQEQCYTSVGVTKILHMSFAVLSLPIKSCFLYFSVFPENDIIQKNRLIRLWGAEGLIRGEDEGESFFNELICRNLIKPVFNYDDAEPMGCSIHGVVLDFIRSLSKEDNFVTVGADLGSGIFPCSINTVRRFSMDNSDEEHILTSRTVHLLGMRSLTVIGDTEERAGHSAFAVSWSTEGKPVLAGFKLIRVLDLENAVNLESQHLEGIEGLLLLKYLGLKGTGIYKLPERIGELEQLETLDVRQTKLSALPASIVGLQRLVRLLVDGAVKLRNNLHVMEGLEEVSTIGIDSISSLHTVVDMLKPRSQSGRSRRLKVLGVSFAGFPPYSAESSREIRSFFIEVANYYHGSFYLHHLHGDFVKCMCYFRQYQFRKLELTLSGPVLAGVVDKITSNVNHLNIEVTQLSQRSVRLLGDLPHLVLLKLVSAEKDTLSTFINGIGRGGGGGGGGGRRRYIIAGGWNAFPRLKVFCFTCKAGARGLQFGSGAMPQLRRLRLSFSARDTEFR